MDKAALDVANSEDFAHTMFLLRQAAKPGNGRAGRGACLSGRSLQNGWGPDPGDNDPLIKTLVPTARGTGNMRRAKSRSELFESRNMLVQLASTYEHKRHANHQIRRVTLMTSPKAWNRCNNTTKHLCHQVYEVEKEAALRKTMENNGTSVVETATARERNCGQKYILNSPNLKWVREKSAYMAFRNFQGDRTHGSYAHFNNVNYLCIILNTLADRLPANIGFKYSIHASNFILAKTSFATVVLD